MKAKHELFELIKDNDSLQPREEFVSATDDKLRQMAIKLDKRRNYKHFSVIATTIALCATVISWIFLLGGNETINMAMSAAGQNKLLPAISQQEPSVYIYHTHNRESFRPELNIQDDKGSIDESKNITLVGTRLKSSLIENNINTLHDDTDFAGLLKEKGISVQNSYGLSRESLKKAAMENKNLKLFIDLHRDSLPRKDTTIVFDKKEYAKISLVLSSNSKYHQENLAFAEAIHNKLEQKYPGLSRGIFLKEGTSKNLDYNQDLMSTTILMNIGGIDSTLEEEYRTADIVADIITELLEED